jgi:hypothetical protein
MRCVRHPADRTRSEHGGGGLAPAAAGRRRTEEERFMVHEVDHPTRTRALPEVGPEQESPGLSTRHLSFVAGGYEVEVRVRTDEFRRSASIAGIVRDEGGRTIPPSRLQVWLASPGSELTSVPLSRRGLFSVRQVAGGRQVLEVVVDCEECHRLCFFL